MQAMHIPDDLNVTIEMLNFHHIVLTHQRNSINSLDVNFFSDVRVMWLEAFEWIRSETGC